MKRRLHAKAPEYNSVRSNFAWPDHVLRMLVTAAAVAWLNPKDVLDPACGDATIVEAANKLMPIEHAHMGDISQAQIADLWGKDMGFKMEVWAGDALEFLKRRSAELVVLTEILEHVENPEEIVAQARKSGRYLVASSPLDEADGSSNHEHLWAWSKYDYEAMLKGAGWDPLAYIPITLYDYPYVFQVWICQ